MDFITDFPMVDGLGSIIVVVNCSSTYSVFLAIPMHCTVEEAVALFLSGVVKHFGLPANIVSDRGARFTSWF